jgi:hypothetical protein
METLNVVVWANQLSKEKMDAIPLKVKYALKKIVSKLDPDAKAFEEFRNQEFERIRNKYFTDEKSYKKTETVMDENDEPVVDENGIEQTREILVVKDEFLNDYQDEIKLLNEKLNEILLEKNTYEYNKCDIEDMVNNLPDDTPLEWDDINLLDALFTEEA